ncbi:Na(+)/H(+) antiporter NhaA [Gordonia hirsuta DSM 44140 = NBRC 16056]|uniref:Na(+)/H(+) antiporter NhaA n=1 Tax=Gordonia hirsuta DSM 44140 = NBRC 16056 TaxID=1121927 RepID=L7L972_9ACTN|nr:Na+/H+ antiporter NhaA [Gordonia hirsuta]GAC57454.1 Na(+)/H(+) antiporter NhaA [Gordonia hirsuta DSM 44140 = NBRC 16056]
MRQVLALSRFKGWIGRDVSGGLLLISAAVIALIWANSPWRGGYHALLDTRVGPSSLHLNLSLGQWAADGLLAIFFFVVGMELKHEFVAGSLRNPRRAGVPVAAAVGGMAVPALVYVGIVATGPSEALSGWAIPSATDIAFALAVLAVFGRGLPIALRVFLMTLAVVDDLLGIIVIATVYTETIELLWLAAGLVCVAIFGLLVRQAKLRLWLLIPVALVAWGCVHASGVHATVAGVLLGFTVPAVAIAGEITPRTLDGSHAITPITSGLALPLFAFAAAGVTVVGADELIQPVSVGVFFGLVVGKVIGVLGTTWLVTRFTPLRLPDAIGLRDLLPVGLLCGIGFTVALLIAELSFTGPDPHGHASAAKLGILVGSLVAAILGGAMLRWDAKHPRTTDMNLDGIPDRNTRLIE